MRSDNEIIRHNMARLINAFASLAEGKHAQTASLIDEHHYFSL